MIKDIFLGIILILSFVGIIYFIYFIIKMILKDTFGKPYYLRNLVKETYKEYSEQLRNYEYFVIVDLENGKRIKKRVNKNEFRNHYVDDRGYAKFRGNSLKNLIRD
ncbi:MAG: hypothetical protein ACK5LT_13020 [Lachnospirales bacterium]